MAQEDDEEDLVFNVEEVQKLVRDNIELCLGGNIYSHSRTPQWITVITEKTLARLNKLNKPFKYIRCDDHKNNNSSEDDCNPEKRHWSPHSGCLLLGHSDGQYVYCSLGEQIHVLYC